MQKCQNTNTTKYKRTKYKCNKKQMQQNTNGKITNRTKCKNKIQLKLNTKQTKYKVTKYKNIKMQIRQNTNETNYKMTMYKRDKIPNDIRNNKIQK